MSINLPDITRSPVARLRFLRISVYYLPRTIPTSTARSFAAGPGLRRWSRGPNQSADQRHDVISLSRHTLARPADTRYRICARRSTARAVRSSIGPRATQARDFSMRIIIMYGKIYVHVIIYMISCTWYLTIIIYSAPVWYDPRSCAYRTCLQYYIVVIIATVVVCLMDSLFVSRLRFSPSLYE